MISRVHAQARRAVLHCGHVGAEPSACRRLGHCLRRSCCHWHVDSEASLGIASQTAIESVSGDGAHPHPACMPRRPVTRKDAAKPMRKMHDPAGAGSLPVDGDLTTLTVRVAGASAAVVVTSRTSESSAIQVAGLQLEVSSKGHGGVDQFGDNGAKPRGKPRPPWGTHSTSAWSPISANRGRRRGSVPDSESGQIGEGRGRGSVPAPGQIGDGDGDGGRRRGVRALRLVLLVQRRP